MFDAQSKVEVWSFGTDVNVAPHPPSRKCFFEDYDVL